jgi:hypothetical protein
MFFIVTIASYIQIMCIVLKPEINYLCLCLKEQAADLEYAAGRHKDAAADDGSDDDGDAVEQRHLRLQLHHVVPRPLQQPKHTR